MIQLATHSDAAGIAELLHNAFTLERYAQASLEDWQSIVRGRDPSTLMWVARVGAVVAGTVSLIMHGSRDAQIAGAGEGELRLLAVDSRQRARGIGAQLAQAAIAAAKDSACQRLVLSTQPSMVTAQRLYERLGFRREEDRDWTTPSGGARIVYTMELYTGQSEARDDVPEERKV